MTIDDWTWQCRICHQRRPNEFISVYSSVKTIKGIPLTHNVRYCNDNTDCIEKAKTFSFFTDNTDK